MVPTSALQQAQQTYGGTCANCHGADDKGNTAAAGALNPPPPDFTRYTLLPQRSFTVITGGYPGTGMVAFGTLPEDERWGLVKQVLGFYQQ